jgi:hypothetical protein
MHSSAASAAGLSGDQAQDLASRVLGLVASRRAALAEFLKRALDIKLQNDAIIIRYAANELLSYKHVSERPVTAFLREELARLVGKPVQVRVTIEENGPGDDEQKRNDPMIDRMLEIFKGTIVPLQDNAITNTEE